MTDQISRVLRVAEVCARTGLCRDDFPAPIQLSPGAIGWLEHEIDEWIARRAAERRVA